MTKTNLREKGSGNIETMTAEKRNDRKSHYNRERDTEIDKAMNQLKRQLHNQVTQLTNMNDVRRTDQPKERTVAMARPDSQFQPMN